MSERPRLRHAACQRRRAHRCNFHSGRISAVTQPEWLGFRFCDQCYSWRIPITAIIRAGLAELGAMREEALGVARRAPIHDRDVFGPYPRIFELAPVRRNQIKVNLRPQIAVSRRTLIQKQQRILDVNGIGVEYLFEQLVGIGELRTRTQLALRCLPRSSTCECTVRLPHADRAAGCRTGAASRPHPSPPRAQRFRASPHETRRPRDASHRPRAPERSPRS